jgi:carboxylate-amine ligase
MITFGVEEEYLLIEPVTGRLAPLAEQVRSAAGLQPFATTEEIQTELLQAQVEVATPVCTALEEVGGHLLRLRHAVAQAAEMHGCRIVASGTPPVRQRLPVPVTDRARYRTIQKQAPQLVTEQMISGMHVHVAVPSRQAGVDVLNRIRVWLPVLTAMAANSPLWESRDTGFASWRTIVFSRWPISGVPPRFTCESDYDTRIQQLLSTEVISDTGQLYWQARLSERYPTVEIRCLDVQLRTDDAVMFAGLARALVETALNEAAVGIPELEPAPELIKVAMWQAARYGLSGDLIDPCGKRLRAGDAVGRLMEHVAPALKTSGDGREVTSLVHRLLQQGTGADRQRGALAEGGVSALLGMMIDTSTMQ